MDDRLDALEKRMSSVEDKFKQMTVELRQTMQTMFSEFAKLKDRRSPNKTVGKFVLKEQDPEQLKGTSHEKLKEGDEESKNREEGTDSGFLKVTTTLVPPSEMPDPKLPVLTGGNDAMFPPPSEPNSSPMKLTAPMKLAVVERERNQGVTVEPPPPPEPPDSDPFMAATVSSERAKEIEIEEEKRTKGIGSHESWVFRDLDGSKHPGRPGLPCSVSIIKNRPKPNSFNVQRPNSNRTISPVVSWVSRPDAKKDQGGHGGECDGGLKLLSYGELMKRKGSGFCLRCGEKFHSRQHCGEKQWKMLIVGDDGVENAGEVLAVEAEENDGEEEDSGYCKEKGLSELGNEDGRKKEVAERRGRPKKKRNREEGKEWALSHFLNIMDQAQTHYVTVVYEGEQGLFRKQRRGGLSLNKAAQYPSQWELKNLSYYPEVVDLCGSSSREVILCNFVKDRGKLFNEFMLKFPMDRYCHCGSLDGVAELFQGLKGKDTMLGNSLNPSFEKQVFKGGVISNEVKFNENVKDEGSKFHVVAEEGSENFKDVGIVMNFDEDSDVSVFINCLFRKIILERDFIMGALVLLFAAHTEIFPTKGIGNGIVLFLEHVEKTTLGILNASTEFAFLLARAVSGDVLTLLNLEEINNRLPPKCSGSETAWMARSLEAGMFSSHQWDPGGKDLVFSYCCLNGVLGKMFGWAQEVFKLLELVLQYRFVGFLVVVTATVLQAISLHGFFSNMKSIHDTNTQPSGKSIVHVWVIGALNSGRKSVGCDMMFGHSSNWMRQWDPGELNCPMIATTYEYCWNVFFNFLGLLNLVFDRGKFFGAEERLGSRGMHISALRTRLFFKGWVVIGTGFGP